MKNALRILVTLVVVQALLLAVYICFQRAREGDSIPVDRLTKPSPDLILRSPDGAISRISDRRGATVVLHFWATWCPPCREELPSLLEFASSGGSEVLAVSVDPEWTAVRSFVDDGSLEYVYLASAGEVADGFDVVELPQTFVIDPTGNLRLHLRGPQDWSSRMLRAMIRNVTDQ